MSASSDDFTEIPGWVRIWANAYWSDGPRPSRKQAHLAEAICLVGGTVFLVASFFVSTEIIATMARVAAVFHLIAGYLISVTVRLLDSYNLWPDPDQQTRKQPVQRTLRSTVRNYGFVLVIVSAFFSAVVFFTG